MEHLLAAVVLCLCLGTVLEVTHAAESRCAPDQEKARRLAMMGLEVQEVDWLSPSDKTVLKHAYSVSAVRSGSVADQAGLRVGDRIAAITYAYNRLPSEFPSEMDYRTRNFGQFYGDEGWPTLEGLLRDSPGGVQLALGVLSEDNQSIYKIWITPPLTACEAEQLPHEAAEKQAEEAQRQRQAMRRTQEAEEAQRQREAVRQAQKAEEAQRQRQAAEYETRVQELLKRHKAIDLSDMRKAIALLKNPFAYQGQHVFLSGGYNKHIGPGQAIINLVPAAFTNPNYVQWDTQRNLAELAVSGKPYVQCIVKVLGTVSVIEGLVEMEIPHVKEIECLK